MIGNLPQGTPTSPALANIIASKLDNEIANYANENNYVYTRYSDDLILSSAANKTMQDAINTVHDVYSIISKNGFITNYAKTKIIKPGSRKIVLGLLVCRNKVTLSRDFKEALETHLFFIKKDMEQHKKIKSFDTTEGMINYVNGLLAYTKNIDKNYYLKIKEKYEWKF